MRSHPVVLPFATVLLALLTLTTHALATPIAVEKPSYAAIGPPVTEQGGATGSGSLLGGNRRITNSASAQNETSIAVDPTNPLVVIGGFNDYRLGTGFAGQGVAVSNDAGATWNDLGTAIPNPANYTVRGGDPGLAFDSNGLAYYNFIASGAGGTSFTRNNGVFVSTSADGGFTWSTAVTVVGNIWPGTGTVPFEDKPLIAADEYPASPFTDNAYISWTHFYDGNHPNDGMAGGGDIFVSRSTDGGASWSAPISLTNSALQPQNGGTGTVGNSRVQGSEPEVASNGDVYVAYWFGDRVDISRSTDGGATFAAPTQPFGTTFGVVATDSPLPNSNFRTNSFPNVEADPTRPGFVYVNGVTDPDGTGTGTDGGDIIFARSTDNGATWEPTLTLNDDGVGSNQIFPWMAVEPTTGDICVIWYDARNDAGNHNLDVYAAFSTDGGATFSANQRITDTNFDPDTGQFMNNSFFGDYNGIGAGGGHFHALWTDARDGEQEIYYDRKGNNPPMADAGEDQTVECTGTATTPVMLDGTGSSDPDNDPLSYLWEAPGIVFDDPTSPTPTGQFPLGTTTVTLTVSDGFDSDQDQVNITIEDTTPPEVTCPDDITVECSASGGTPADDPQLVDFFNTFAATDICDADLDVVLDAPAFFPLGDTIVTLTATDDSNNSNSCSATVTVVDTTPPEITVELNRHVLWPPNHRMVDIFATVVVEDICDPDPTFVLVQITSNEPDEGLGDGDFPNDIQGTEFGTPDIEFQLRSERSGVGDGRIYTILYTASDLSGNTADAVVEVMVPHDRRGGARAAGGYTPDGTAFLAGESRYTIVVMTVPAGPDTPPEEVFDASLIVVDQVYVGNTVDALRPLVYNLTDADGDGFDDLVLEYSVSRTMDIVGASTAIDGPVGLHYHIDDQVERIDWLVDDIFALGPPIDPSQTTGVEAPIGASPPPTVTTLSRIYPNPFNPSTTVAFDLAESGRVDLEVYDARGALVRVLARGFYGAGSYEIAWDGRDNLGREVGSGIYLVRFASGDYQTSQKTVLLK